MCIRLPRQNGDDSDKWRIMGKFVSDRKTEDGNGWTGLLDERRMGTSRISTELEDFREGE